MTETRVQPYGLDPAFEAVVVLASCTSPKFWGHVAKAVEVDAFRAGAARHAMGAVIEIERQTGSAPESTVTILQHLRARMDRGQFTFDQLAEVSEFLDAAEDRGMPPEAEVLAQFAPILRRREHHRVVTEAMKEYREHGDFMGVLARLTAASRLGEVDQSGGLRLGLPALDRIAALRTLEKLPFGILELDAVCDGGLARGDQGVLVGGTGVGKSMLLVQIAATTLLARMNVAYATTELSEEEVAARLFANLTGVPTNTIKMGGDGSEMAAARFLNIEHRVGGFEAKYFTRDVSTPADVFGWLEELEKTGFKPHLLIVDSPRELRSESGKEQNHLDKGVVFGKFRDWGRQTKSYVWVSDQPQRGKKDRKRIDTDDLSDSSEPSRLCDMLITFVRIGEGDEQEIEAFVAKNRVGTSRKSAGPWMPDYTCARIAPPNRDEFDEAEVDGLF